jgi:hypothetical protein
MLALGGCGGGGTRHQATNQAGAGQPPDEHFTGGSIPGTVYLGMGPDPYSIDAYRLSGPLARTRRITYSPLALGLLGFAANAQQAVVQRRCCGGLQFLEKLNLNLRGGLPGTVIGPGTSPALARDGRLAYVVAGYHGCACDALLVRRGLRGADRLVYREPHPGSILANVWSRDGRLALLLGTTGSDGLITKRQLVLDPGSAHERRIQVPSLVLESGIWFGPHDELSYQPTGRVVIQQPTGASRSFLLGNWNVGCWLASGRIIAWSFDPNRLGLLDPSTGKIAPVGRFAPSSDLFVLDCPAGG